jgi:hypothetical protein
MIPNGQVFYGLSHGNPHAHIRPAMA